MIVRAFDSHLHFDTFRDAGTHNDMLDRASVAGIQRIMAIGGHDSANRLAIQLAVDRPTQICASVGYDRDLACAPNDLDALRELAQHACVRAIGETGLDYHYEPGTRTEQMTLFEAQLEIAASSGKPVIIHSREADEDTIHLLSLYAARWSGPGGSPGVLHCFTGGADFARRLLDRGFMISFSGIVTFKRSEDLRAVARMVPADRILAETDAPYLAPVPHRGKTNEAAFLIETLRVLAEVRAVSLEEMAIQSYLNASRLFNWPEPESCQMK